MNFDRIFVENRSRDPPGAPWTSKECLGTIWSVPGALWECPGSGPGAARERPRSTKRGTFEGSKFERIQEPKFRSHFEHVEPKNDRIFGRYSSTFERSLEGNLMIRDSTEMEPILNNFCRTSSKNRVEHGQSTAPVSKNKGSAVYVVCRVLIEVRSHLDRILIESLSNFHHILI